MSYLAVLPVGIHVAVFDVETVPLVRLVEVRHSLVLTEVRGEAVVPGLRLQKVHLQQGSQGLGSEVDNLPGLHSVKQLLVLGLQPEDIVVAGLLGTVGGQVHGVELVGAVAPGLAVRDDPLGGEGESHLRDGRETQMSGLSQQPGEAGLQSLGSDDLSLHVLPGKHSGTGGCLVSELVPPRQEEEKAVLVVDIRPVARHVGPVDTLGPQAPDTWVVIDYGDLGLRHQLGLPGDEGRKRKVRPELDGVTAGVLYRSLVGLQHLLISHDAPQSVLGRIFQTFLSDIFLHLLRAFSLLHHRDIGVNSASEPKCLISRFNVLTARVEVEGGVHQPGHDGLVNVHN